jgi:hypothetical protein
LVSSGSTGILVETKLINEYLTEVYLCTYMSPGILENLVPSR